MTQEAGPHVASLYRYPVKGLSPEQIGEATLTIDGVVPFDRAYAIENGAGRFDAAAPKHLPKINFLMLMRDERLATLQTSFDTQTHTLVIRRHGKQVASGDLQTRIGRQLIEQFLSAYMGDTLRGPPKIVSAPGLSFTNIETKALHIVNLATVRVIEREIGRPVDPRRFRANIYLEGVEPWQEFSWLDSELVIGTTRLSVFRRTRRCDATNVDPMSGARDMAIPAALLSNWGHMDFGVYAKVTSAGRISAGDRVVVT